MCSLVIVMIICLLFFWVVYCLNVTHVQLDSFLQMLKFCSLLSVGGQQNKLRWSCFLFLTLFILCDRTQLKWWRNSWLVTQKTCDSPLWHFAKLNEAAVIRVIFSVCFNVASVSVCWHCFMLPVWYTLQCIWISSATSIPKSSSFSIWVGFC